jgi:hypothetical protein
MKSGKRDLAIDPKEALCNGAKILGPMLVSNGFVFHFRNEGSGSGGKYAWGDFVRKDRRLELHFRHSLGLVRYHVREWKASHEAYMRELGVWTQCRYPGFSETPTDAFYSLAHDLQFAGDFLSGRGDRVKKASAMEKIDASSREAEYMAASVGDARKRGELRSCFRRSLYSDVITLARALKFPDLMTQSEKKMVEIARKRTKPLYRPRCG